MNPLLRAWLLCCVFIFLVGCEGSDSEPSDRRYQPAHSSSAACAAACEVILDYTNQYEEIYLHHEGPETERRLSELTRQYNEQMGKLTAEGKQTPLQGLGMSIKLSFLMGQFYGALQSCKIEKAQENTLLTGCDMVKKLRNTMADLCSEDQ